jgi:hypothetical protein
MAWENHCVRIIGIAVQSIDGHCTVRIKYIVKCYICSVAVKPDVIWSQHLASLETDSGIHANFIITYAKGISRICPRNVNDLF